MNKKKQVYGPASLEACKEFIRANRFSTSFKSPTIVPEGKDWVVIAVPTKEPEANG